MVINIFILIIYSFEKNQDGVLVYVPLESEPAKVGLLSKISHLVSEVSKTIRLYMHRGGVDNLFKAYQS